MTFGPIQIRYDDQVLRPRTWTLLQATWAAEIAASSGPGRLLELCSGAGHIGQAAAFLADRHLVQVDVDAHACDLARDNAEHNNLQDRVDVRWGDLEGVLDAADRFPLILADPPYLPTTEVADWPADPQRSIDGGEDGLDVHRRCLAVASKHLLPGGAILLQTLGLAQVVDLSASVEALALDVAEVREVDARRAVALLRPSA